MARSWHWSVRMMKPILLTTLIFFGAVNAYALVDVGLVGLLTFITDGNAWTLVAGADLCIALGLVLTWMIRDAKKRGVSAMPYLALTLTTGSIGPLVYLLRRD